MSQQEEGTLRLDDGRELYTKTWKPTGNVRAVILFIHGFSDHVNRYKDFFPVLNEQGFLVHGFDQRGWGQSVKKPNEKGLTGPTSQVLADITAFVRSHLPSPQPVFLMGHSMGGQETLYFAARGPLDLRRQISGFIAMSPFIQLHPVAQPSWLKVHAGRLAGRLFPNMPLVSKLDPSWMSHDEALNQDWSNDPLCHDTGTLQGMAGMLDRCEELHSGTVAIEEWDGFRILLVHGTEDFCTWHDATKQFSERLVAKHKEFKPYAGSKHCTHIDKTQELVADITRFIETAPQQTSAVPSKL